MVPLPGSAPHSLRRTTTQDGRAFQIEPSDTAETHNKRARCDDCMGKKEWTCKRCKEVASPTVSFTQFQKIASSGKNPERACCDKCWHVWAACIKCKKMLPKAEFDLWLDAMPSRRHSGKTKLMSCNACMRENREAATELAKNDLADVMKKRQRDT